jgi:hypothetical protein|nr:MAG TPA: hypothetical protein [Bacteriophage sp.]
MRLIDADALKKNLKSVTLSNGTLLNTNTVLILLDKYPTAYDADKVVEQLKTDSLVKLYGSGNSDNYLIPVKRAIEIVKAGGIDER